MKSNELCEKILFTEEEIALRCEEIASQIEKDVEGEDVVFVAVLNGSFMFASELVKRYKGNCNIDFIQVSTYGNSTETTGQFVIKKPLSLDISGKHVVIIEDIVDTGFTMVNLYDYLGGFSPKSVRICTMIDKPHRRTNEVNSDYIAYTMTEEYFIVGFGLDYAQKYRNLPYIGILRPEFYS